MKYNETIISKDLWEKMFEYNYLKDDGTPDLNEIRVTLYLYHCMLEKVSEVYNEITQGEINDPHCEPAQILQIVSELEEDFLDFVDETARIETIREMSKPQWN